MSLQHDDGSPRAPAARPRGWLRAVIVGAMAILFVGAAMGFIAFLSQLRGVEIKPARNADGIVVLTGGSSRVSDAMELLVGGYGKRLLISGVHPTNAVSDISRSLPDNQSLLLRCCVDLDRSAVNTRSNAAETRRWARERGFKSLIVVTSNYHMPRAILELAHAMPDVTLIPFAVVGDRWRDEPWWTSGATLRLLLSEYAKYVAAEVRVRLADAGVGQPHAHFGGEIFRVFRQQETQRRTAGPPRLVAPPVADHRERNQRDIRHRMRQFQDGARHVVVRRHHDQRLEAALAGPAPRLRGIAARVDGGTIEIDATAQQQR